MGGLGGRGTPLALAEGFPFPPTIQGLLAVQPAGQFFDGVNGGGAGTGKAFFLDPQDAPLTHGLQRLKMRAAIRGLRHDIHRAALQNIGIGRSRKQRFLIEADQLAILRNDIDAPGMLDDVIDDAVASCRQQVRITHFIKDTHGRAPGKRASDSVKAILPMNAQGLGFGIPVQELP